MSESPESSSGEPVSSSDEEEQRRTPAQEAARKHRLADVFGDVLPEGARDEHGDGWGEHEGGLDAGRDDEWLRRQVPPHHG